MSDFSKEFVKTALLQMLTIIEESVDVDIRDILYFIEKGVRGKLESDYITTSDAMAYLNIKSRNVFFDLVKKHGLKVHTFNNLKIGYLKREISEIKDEMRNYVRRQYKCVPSARQARKSGEKI